MSVLTFYLAGGVALAAALMVILSTNPVHALLSLVLSLLALGTVFFALGAPFAGILEVIVYAGAIMVLFVYVVMMLNLGRQTLAQERAWLTPRVWILPTLLCALLFVTMVRALWPAAAGTPIPHQVIDAKAVGVALYGPYLLAVELGSMLLLAGLVAAYHLGKTDH